MDPIMNPFSSGTRLRDMIRAIRACKTAAEERSVIRKECASIRASIGENDPDYRHRNLAKLMFIHMLGYPTHFGQMECLKLIVSTGFPDKRIGYLGLMLLLDERQEVLMLVTNSIKQDLNHSNQYIVGLALCALGNICSAEMARDLAPEVERLLQFRDPNIRKKAALCSIRIIRKVPELAENFVNTAASLLKEKHHGSLITGIQLCIDLCTARAEALEYFRKMCIDVVVRTLKDVVNSRYGPEYDISGIADPFLQIRLLRFLHVLGQGDADASDSMNDILAQVATKIESNKVVGNAILYECVGTIMSIEDSGGLRVLAINILGKFLSNRDNNIRYVALNMLMKAITVDSQAVQRHRVTILECVKDSDISIRKRALEIVCLLVNESNVKPLTKELIEYLTLSDQEFKGDLTAKICSIVDNFSTEKIWYIDQMLRVLSEAGNFVKDEVWYALIVVIGNASNLHGYTVRALYRAIKSSYEQATLVRVAVWCIGEYGEILVNNIGMLDSEEPVTITESDAVDVIENVTKHHSSDLATKEMCLISLLKLSCRFPACSQRIKNIINQCKGSLVLELQQRAIEFDSIIAKHQNIRSMLAERMPVLDEATYCRRRTVPVSVQQVGVVKLPNGSAKPSSAAPLVDLLDLSSDDAQVPSASGLDLLQNVLGLDLSSSVSQSGNSQSQKNGSDVLMDLLSIGTPVQGSSNTPDIFSLGQASTVDIFDGFSPSPARSEDNGTGHAPIVGFESSSLRLKLNFSKPHGNPQITDMVATFTNKTSNSYTDFIFQAAVPKFLHLHLEPANSNSLPGNGSITQNLQVTNSQYGKKSIVMRIRIAYKSNNKDMLEEGEISNFPRGL
ncbi:AP-1 complex subunit gamma-2-like [Impatiens glandulifera]|uniref:AP-1 complex subunit gamma-2-like n=1 Tax=Impatiens glandulifera TaxID=253017 RepID=UPI001FB17717|nr:AP-1 complex subunit gamma-2-like [Impatiens glandulifera]